MSWQWLSWFFIFNYWFLIGRVGLTQQGDYDNAPITLKTNKSIPITVRGLQTLQCWGLRDFSLGNFLQFPLRSPPISYAQLCKSVIEFINSSSTNHHLSLNANAWQRDHSIRWSLIPVCKLCSAEVCETEVSTHTLSSAKVLLNL